jgi:hypothetical protein
MGRRLGRKVSGVLGAAGTAPGRSALAYSFLLFRPLGGTDWAAQVSLRRSAVIRVGNCFFVFGARPWWWRREWGFRGRRRWRRRWWLVRELAELLPRRDSLYPERVAARPTDLVLHFAVRADGLPCNLLSQPGRSNYSHSALAISTPEDFLHTPS